MSEAASRLRQVLKNCVSIRGDKPTGYPYVCATVGLRKDDLDALLAEVRDLKARLRAVREAWYDPGGDHEDDERIPRATDLRVRDWRKP